MSHLKERKEKNCLNCKAELYGRYCHVCGQENLEPKESVWHLVQHFFNDITHFDGKFFSTGKYLLKKPGFLSAEYMAGRRASYLNPIRMYVFTSAIFFIIFFSLKSPKDMVKMDNDPKKEKVKEKGKGLPDLIIEKTKLDSSIAKIRDTDDRKDAEEEQAKLVVEIDRIKKIYGDTTTRKFSKPDRAMLLLQAYADTASAEEMPAFVRDKLKKASQLRQNENEEGSNFFGLHQSRYKSLEEYDSTERALPDSLKDGWFKHLVMRRLVLTEEEFHKDKKSYFEHFAENMLHSFPKILFFSLPFFALILRLLYIRRKQYYYVSHGIFAIHVYCATFILTLGVILFDRLMKLLDYRWFNVIGGLAIFALVLYWFIYLFKAMRRFYGQGRGKTFLKYILLSWMAFTINMILLVIFLLISAIFI